MTTRVIPNVIDLFSGAGGFSLGFQAAGCRIRAAVDVDPVAGSTFQKNFSVLQPDYPPLVLAGPEHSIEQIDLDKLAEDHPPHIVIGGPPCQAFSRLGRAKLDSLSEEGFVGDPRNRLFRKFLKAVSHWQPLAVVMENVPGMMSVGGKNYAEDVLWELADLGYTAGYAQLNAAWYGVPQFRERVFFIGIRAASAKEPISPAITHDVPLPEGYRSPMRSSAPMLPFGGSWNLIRGELPVPREPSLMPAVTVRQALDDLMPLRHHLNGESLPRGEFRKHVRYRREATCNFSALMRNWPGLPVPSGVVDHVTRRTPRDYETFRRMKPGDRYPEALKIARERFAEALTRLEKAGNCPAPGTEAWHEMEARFVPPYDEEEFPDKWRKLIPDMPSWTVPAHLAKDSYSHIHHDTKQARMISVREAARLQSFPDAFSFCGNVGDCFRQIGNAVPPLLSWSIAHALLDVLGFNCRKAPVTAQIVKKKRSVEKAVNIA